ncbi:Ketohexokinase [Pleurostoma richardsiae]|uniref:Ketohexokinase n=1 Tax=Pleurostoma richardsiae TaxID=41990 RepID=A0AA38RUQ8_9PEZI|nr:Ketohexokinase [Pleurostoma richardsiae]
MEHLAYERTYAARQNKGAKMKRLIMVGACYLDTILSVPHFPEEDTKLRATKMHVRRGGNCPNSLEVLQQLLAHDPEGQNVTTHLVSCLPNAQSPATATIQASFGPQSAVDFSRCIYRDDQTEPASSFVLRSQATGSRTIVNHNGLAEMTVQEFVQAVDSFSGEEECWWHFEGRIPETTQKCIQHLREVRPRDKILVEVEKPDREGLRELAAEADVVFYSRSWAESQGYIKAEDCLKGEAPSQASIVLCTWGAEGACALSLPGGECWHCPVQGAERDFRVVDDDWIAERKLRLAVNLATAKVQIDGFEGLAAGLSLAAAS